MSDRHGLVNSMVSDALNLLIESRGVYIKHDNKGNDSLVTNTESRDEIFDVLNKASENSGSRTFYQNHHLWQENQDARLPLYECIVIDDDDHLAQKGENSKEAVPISDRIESPFIAELNGMRYQESENLVYNTLWENGGIYTVIQSICDKLSFERRKLIMSSKIRILLSWKNYQ